MKRKGGKQRKSRRTFTKKSKNKGKVSITNYLQQFEKGDNVKLRVEPAVHKGMYHPRFKGKPGVVQDKQGECYVIKIKDGNKTKHVTVHPVHLKKDE